MPLIPFDWNRLALTVFWASLVLWASPHSSRSEEPADPSLLTLDRIYGGGEFQSRQPSLRWLTNSAGYTTLESSKNAPQSRDIVRWEADTGKQSVLVSAADLSPSLEDPPLSIENYSFSEDQSLVLIFTNSKRVWRRNTRGDYWVFDLSNRQLRKLNGFAKPSLLMFAKLSPTGEHAAYVYERNIYLESLRDGSVRQLTETPNEHIINGTFDWVYEEELGLRDGFRFSPDGRRIAFWQLDTTGVEQIPLVNNTDSFYPKITWIPYPKTGQRNSACRAGVIDLESGKIGWIPLPGDSREHYLARMEWAESSSELLLQQLNRRQNTNRLMLYDVPATALKTILTERDEAWVDVHDELHWIDGGKEFSWVSERDGWRHVYWVSRDGTQTTLATPGEFDVIQLSHVDEKERWLYFIASPDNPAQRYLYRVKFDGSELTRITPASQSGWHEYQISPNGQWAVHARSDFETPPRSELVKLPSHERQRHLERNQALIRKVRHLKRSPVEFFHVNVGDNVDLDGWCIKPPDFDPTKKYPLLVYVYGEPAGQTVTDRWGGASYLWHAMLAQQGYVVVSMDNRGTNAPRGRAWRKAAYEKIGVLSPQEQAAGVKALLKDRSYLDPQRVGIWGWSGGGSSSLHAIFKYPKLYRMAIAIAPVPNQRYYDTIYQERYMGLPSDNVEGYRQGSAINFAHQLKGDLLLIHGTGDDNCHYQTTELLINELVRHNKPFRMFAYPNRTHAIREGKNTTRHLREMMTQFLHEKLPR
jgi:dipeptidyl-peptidase 4